MMNTSCHYKPTKMRTFLLSTALLISVAVKSQTHFYINAIAVDPQAPTTTDIVSIDLIGDLSSTGAFVSSATAVVTGNTVSISITAEDPGGATVLVPHTEPIAIGMLPAGDYEIVVLGTNVNDFAVPSDHQFTVTGGSPCDDVVIDFVRWAAFSDTALTVHVFNNSTELFDYPGFVLLDMDGDTLAKETVNFFGIALESTHTLTIHPGAVIPVGTSSYELQLWTGFYEEQACAWQLNLDLCPAPPCEPMMVGLQNFGNALTIGDFDWVVMDADMQSVGNGQLTLTDSVQYDWDTVCLPPGQYRLLLTPLQQSTGGQPYFGVDQIETFGWFRGPNTPLVGEAPVELLFEFYPACVDGSNTVQEIDHGQGFRLDQYNDGIELMNLNGKAIGIVEVFDANGRMVLSKNGTSNTLQIDLGRFSSGLMIVRASGVAHRFIWSAL
mgnify:CR=1 FL=1